jgi:pimeloyl-ACP methyl ester carboxylesterase
LRPQPRGIGGSIGPLEGITLHDLAADVASVVATEGQGPAVVIGHAFGNWVARTLAADRPDLVRGIVLAAAALKGPLPPGVREASI